MTTSMKLTHAGWLFFSCIWDASWLLLFFVSVDAQDGNEQHTTTGEMQNDTPQPPSWQWPHSLSTLQKMQVGCFIFCIVWCTTSREVVTTIFCLDAQGGCNLEWQQHHCRHAHTPQVNCLCFCTWRCNFIVYIFCIIRQEMGRHATSNFHDTAHSLSTRNTPCAMLRGGATRQPRNLLQRNNHHDSIHMHGQHGAGWLFIFCIWRCQLDVFCIVQLEGRWHNTTTPLSDPPTFWNDSTTNAQIILGCGNRIP